LRYIKPKYRCDFRIQREILIIDEKATHASEVYRSEEVLKVDIKDVTSFEMFEALLTMERSFLNP